MRDLEPQSAIEYWLSDVRTYFSETASELLPLFDIYAAEAVFGRAYIASDLKNLRSGARLLEIGAGSLLLSCQLVREGFQVTGIEPTGDGFSHFEQLRDRVRERAETLGCLPRVLNLTGEALSERDCFDYAFSVNVMEHVDDVARVIVNVGRSLVVGASYRFTCPNYLFPYEPHFNIPTLISKKITEIAFTQKIFSSKKMPDPSGTWKSLNWINVLQVRNVVKQLEWQRVTFNRSLLVSTLERITFDRDFANRRALVVRKFLGLFVWLRLHLLLRFVPAVFQPIIDCSLQKISDSEAL